MTFEEWYHKYQNIICGIGMLKNKMQAEEMYADAQELKERPLKGRIKKNIIDSSGDDMPMEDEANDTPLFIKDKKPEDEFYDKNDAEKENKEDDETSNDD